MERLSTSNLKLGIIAGGQLGKMLIQEASKWDIVSFVLDDDEDCPAGSLANHFVKGSRFDFDSVYEFGKLVDVLTFEIESINIEALQKLKSEGVKIIPDPDILGLIQDKGLQKEFYSKNDIPTARYILSDSDNDIKKALGNGEISFPFVQKLRKGGYDGRGVAVIDNEAGLDSLLEGPSIIEEKISISKEIAVIVARNAHGDVQSFPVVEMIFDPRANLVDNLICPAAITPGLSEKATKIAAQAVTQLDMVGLLAVELFIDDQDRIYLNEIAPRPHNSGHHTIESMITSQYEQHLRAILDLPLGSTKLKMPAVMVNILGEEGYSGPVLYEGLKDIMAIEGVKIHLYGKKITRPYRKMGHVTIISDTLEESINKAEAVQNLIKVKSWKKS